MVIAQRMIAEPPRRFATRAHPTIPSRLNAALGAGVVATNTCGLLLAPALIAPHPAIAAGWLAAFALAGPMQWGLVHEAIHGLFAHSVRWNRAAGRTLAVLLLFSFDAVRFGHLTHHAQNGHDFDRPDRGDPDAGARIWARHYFHILGCHYLGTSLSAFAAFLPWKLLQPAISAVLAGDGPGTAPVREAALRRFAPARRRRAIQVDCLAAAALIAASAACYGSAWPWLAAALYARALLLSLLDNMPHYGMTGREAAAVPAFRLPGKLSVLVMNHHLHRTHHLRPHLPWTSVPTEFARTDGRYDGAYLTGILRQFRGPSRA